MAPSPFPRELYPYHRKVQSDPRLSLLLLIPDTEVVEGPQAFGEYTDPSHFVWLDLGEGYPPHRVSVATDAS